MNFRRKIFYIIFSFFILFLFSLSFLFAQDLLTANNKPEFYNLFSAAEKKLYDSLPEVTKQKLIALYKLVKEKKLGNDKVIENSSTTSAIIPSRLNTLQNPYLNNLLSSQPRPQVQNNGYVAPLGSSERAVWGAGGEGESPYVLGRGQSYIPENFSSLQPALGPDALTNYKPTGADPKCDNFGVINKSSNINVLSQVKFDLGRICSAMQRKLVVVDAVRANKVFSDPCQPPSRHLSREAIDYEIKNYGAREDQMMLIIAFISLGYNIGSYQNNFPLHADRGQCPHWQTWSKVANSSPSQYLPYQQPVVDALNAIGLPARSSGEFTSLYGRVSRSVMKQKAQEVIKRTGNQKMIEFLIPQESI